MNPRIEVWRHEGDERFTVAIAFRDAQIAMDDDTEELVPGCLLDPEQARELAVALISFANRA